MAVYPRIDSPCPYKSDLAAVMEGDLCRMCNRRVIDLTAMADADRLAFLGGCREEVCVSYRMPIRNAIAAAAMAAAAVAMPTAAAAQDEEVEMIIVGGIKDPSKAQLVEDAADAAMPDLPVVYEAEEDRAQSPQRGAEPQPAKPARK